NGKKSRGRKHKANVSKNETQQKNQPEIKKPKKIGTRESLAIPKPSKSRFILRWSPTGRLFDQAGKINDSSESKSQYDRSNGYSDLFMVRRFGLFQAHDSKSKASHQFRLEVYGNCPLLFHKGARGKGTIELYFVKTDYQLADIFTKALPTDRFNYLVRHLGMRILSPKELEHLAKSL
nr:retrovirus-related Pol polyprotein from transposon TNT 1-94 [Tanacetum cinerariifolium]